MNFVSSLTATSTPSPSTSNAPFPSDALRRHQVFHLLQYTFCVLPPTDASARVSTTLSASLSSPPPLTYVPARRGFRSVHDSAFRVIASHTMSPMYSVAKSGCGIVSKNSQPLLPILRSLYPLVRASAGCGRSFLLAVWKFRPVSYTHLTLPTKA